MGRQPIHRAVALANAGGNYAGTLIDHPCIVTSIFIEHDDTNDPTVVFYDNTSAAGDRFLPRASFDASLLGWNGATSLDEPVNTALHLTITCAGTARVFVNYL